jgi:phosphoglycerol transferase MdoB-like AlkP superfamily enzyme
MHPVDPAGSGPRMRVARLLRSRHGLLALGALGFLGVALATRLVLLGLAAGEVAWDASLAAAFAWGFVFDVGACSLVLLPLALLLAALPASALQRPWARAVVVAGSTVVWFLLYFGAVAEGVFWEEFGTRFNFIAVDYLVYTTEVVGNVRESYPLGWILAGLGAAALATTTALWRRGLPREALRAPPGSRSGRWRAAGVCALAALVAVTGLAEDDLPAFSNNYDRELAKNGLWSLFAAFRGNVLDYPQFYCTVEPARAFDRLRQELVEDGSVLLRPREADTLRYVANPGPELHPNVIQITVESLSARFLGAFDPGSTLTPCLDDLAGRSLFFENFYATGTRTDRGMEALCLSLPPTPGRSVLKRPSNEDLFTLGSVFRSRGYDTAFLYGGYGYFDNMNAFFGGNGYRVVDRGTVDAKDVTFANAWGACDEDLYRWALREADAVHASGRPFHFFVMTTSNHRPFTYPEGRIDLPPKSSGRAGAVKYTDWAIGAFLREAATRPWYRDTVFVVVADHCAASAGKAEIAVQNYHVPLLVFAPGGQIAPGRVQTLTSQMDYAPTLLGLLGWSYPSRFFGHDVRRIEPDEAHALVGNYQRLGHLEKGALVVLAPRRQVASYRFDIAAGRVEAAGPDAYAQSETIAYYQAASAMYAEHRYRDLSAAENAASTAEGERLLAGRPAGGHPGR